MMATRVRGRESDESGARVGIQMRSALTHQIGRAERSLRARRRLARFLGEDVVRITPVFRQHSETIAEKAQR